MNKQKGAANTMLVILVVILLAAVAYFAFIKKPEVAVAPATVTGTDQSSATGTTAGTPSSTSSTSSGLSVPGMQQYTDTAFGFSFWYPTNWQVTVPQNPPFGAQLTGVTAVKTLGLQPSGQAYPSIIIQEAKSTQRTITDTGGAGPIGPVTYYFDANTHLWMTKTSATGTATAANISVNTMGGLHMFGGTSRFDTTIVPLTANNFVVIGDGGAANATAVTKTIVALDPAVAVPVSIADQTRTIQQEMAAIAATAPSTTVAIPTKLPDYITENGTWPPVIKTSSAAYSCKPGKGNADIDEETVQTVVNGRTYCIHSTSDGYAGGAGIERTYTTAATGGGTKIADFTLLYGDCGAYKDSSASGGTKYNQCKTNEGTFDTNLNALIDSLMVK